MTTIAWDGRVLAADRQSTSGTTPHHTTKIHEAIGPDGRRWIWAASGLSSEAQEFERCVREGRELPTFKDLVVLAIDHLGQAWQRADNGFWELKQVSNWGQGSGADYALGAMAAGASAIEAVMIASRLDVHTGMGVDWIALDGTKGSRP